MGAEDDFADRTVEYLASFVIDSARSKADPKLVAEADSAGNDFDTAVLASDGKKARDAADKWIAAWRRAVNSIPKAVVQQPSLF